MGRKITADIRDKIREFVDVIEPFLPLSSHSKRAVTFSTLFRESGVDRYLGDGPKRQVLQRGWEQVVRRHPKLPFTLIRKIVPASISYRRYRRNPLRKSELMRLTVLLEALGIDMRAELGAIELDETVPEIRVAPEKLLERLQDHPLVPEICGEPLQMLRNGHFNEAVRKAAERFETAVQVLSCRSEIGKELMGKVFSGTTPLISLNSLSTENERGIQEGYMLMTMGMMRAIRNVFSHGDEHQRPPEAAFEMLLFLNWLFHQLPARS